VPRCIYVPFYLLFTLFCVYTTPLLLRLRCCLFVHCYVCSAFVACTLRCLHLFVVVLPIYTHGGCRFYRVLPFTIALFVRCLRLFGCSLHTLPDYICVFCYEFTTFVTLLYVGCCFVYHAFHVLLPRYAFVYVCSAFYVICCLMRCCSPVCCCCRCSRFAIVVLRCLRDCSLRYALLTTHTHTCLYVSRFPLHARCHVAIPLIRLR